jgi:hypothetical protein
MLTLKDFQPYQLDNLVRMGPKNDGGYIVPENYKSKVLISFGLGNNWDFEKSMIKKGQISKYVIFDHTVDLSLLLKSIFSSLKSKQNIYIIVFKIKVFLLYFKDFIILNNLHIKKKVVARKYDFNSTDLREVMKTFTEGSKNIFLKCDIDNGEYDIINDIILFNHKIEVLVIEFHDIIERKIEFKNCLEKLKKHYSLVHSHANNYSFTDDLGIPNVCEFTFVKKSSHKLPKKVKQLPVLGLDAPCSPLRPEIRMVFK